MRYWTVITTFTYGRVAGIGDWKRLVVLDTDNTTQYES
jgi:hypothetical protein